MQEVTRREKRSQHRYSYLATIDYTIANGSDEIHKAVVVDISPAGMCLYVFNNHHHGQQIAIRSDLPVGMNAAELCWIAKEDEEFYRSGFRFL